VIFPSVGSTYNVPVMFRRAYLPLVAFACAITVSFVVPAAGSADSSSFGSKVSSQLVAAATAPGVTASTPLHVIVYGTDLGEANIDLGSLIQIRQPLGAVGGESVTVNEGDLGALTAEPGVSYLTLDPTIATTGAVVKAPIAGTALVTSYPQTDDVLGAWQSGITGKNVGVAVIDSGVTPGPDFQQPNRLQQIQLQGQQGGAALNDPYGHGTFVAGVIGGDSFDGHLIGIAPGSNLNAINLSRPDGLRSSDVIAALLWVLAHHKDRHISVVNLSLTETTTSSYLQSPLDAVIEKLWQAGVVVVVSAGNLGPGTTSYAPANDPFVITVGATDTTVPGTTSVASFSSSGLTQDGIQKPEIMAPGRRIGSILSANTALGNEAPASALLQSGYAMMSGTSFSAPQISGAAADLLQAYPNLTPDQVKAILVQSATPVVGSPAGTLDLGAALALAANPPANAQQTWQPARWSVASSPGLTGPDPVPSLPAPLTMPTKPDTVPAVPLPSVPQAVNYAPCAPGVCTAATTADQLAGQTHAAGDWAKAAQAWETFGNLAKAATDWEKAGQAYTGAGDTANSAKAYTNAATDWQTAQSLDHAAQDWANAGNLSQAAATYEAELKFAAAAQLYEKTADYGSAGGVYAVDARMYERANVWDKAAAAWDTASQEWQKGGDATQAAAMQGNAATDWDSLARDQVAAGNVSKAADAWDHASSEWQNAGNSALAASAEQTQAAAWENSSMWNKAAAAWDKAAKVWATAAAWDTSANAYEAEATDLSRAAAWDKSAAAWDSAATAWTNNGSSAQATASYLASAGDYQRSAASWEGLSTWDKAAAAWEGAATQFNRAAAWDRSAAAWDNASGDWANKGRLDIASNDLNAGGTMWATCGRWDNAAYDWQLAASDKPGQTWDNANTKTDAAAWDAAAWDAAAWD
jgi:serine protease AprX